MDINARQKKFKRIRRVKKILRHIPRRASLHRYPIIRRFADEARERPYLWSFRTTEVEPALYLGWIIMLTPLPAIVHLIIAFILAMVCRANLTIILVIPLISNTFTFLFWWALTYKVGQLTISLFGPNTAPLIALTEYHSIMHGANTIRALLTITLGAFILGPILGAISSMIYKLLAKKYTN